MIGTIELLQVAARKLALEGSFWSFVNERDFAESDSPSTPCSHSPGPAPRALEDSAPRTTLDDLLD
jgi:hypothetical protein